MEAEPGLTAARKLAHDAQELDKLLEKVSILADNGYSIDGAHHKRWAAQQILALLDVPLVRDGLAIAP